MEKPDSGLAVVKVAKENHDTTSISFSGPGIERFKKRQAGQFATIRVFREGAWSEPHPFTLSCAPEDPDLRMTIKESGTFTSGVIPHLAPGTPIQCAGPYGQFCRGIESHAQIVMIAGGVGITPFLSVLRHFREIGAQNELLLLWANKTPDDAFASAELEDYTAALRLHVVHVFSRVAPEAARPAPEFADGRPGRVSHEYGRLGRDILGRHLLHAAPEFYLCGPPAMQEGVLAELAKCGVEPEKVHKEAFVFGQAKS